jgi:hypothetical protein
VGISRCLGLGIRGIVDGESSKDQKHQAFKHSLQNMRLREGKARNRSRMRSDEKAAGCRVEGAGCRLGGGEEQ